MTTDQQTLISKAEENIGAAGRPTKARVFLQAVSEFLFQLKQA